MAVSAQGAGASSDKLIEALERNATVTSSLTKQLADFATMNRTAASATEAMGVSATAAGAAAQQAAVGIKAATAASNDNARAVKEMEQAAARLRAQLDPLGAAQARVSEQIATYSRLAAAGVISTKEQILGIDLAQRSFAQGAVAIGKSGTALHDHAASTGLNRMQMLELTHVAKSLFDELAAGQSPIRALTLEGGRIGEVFSMGSGGVGGTMKSIGSSIMGLLSPVNLAIGGFTALGAAAVYSVVSYEEAQRKLEASTNGVGRFSGLSLGGLNQVAANGARTGNISTSQGRDLAGTFNATGRIGGDLNEQLIGSTKTYGRIIGESDIGAVGEQLAKAFSDPAKGADMLNEKLGFLDDKTKELIRTQTASLDVFGAQGTMFAAYADDIAKATDHTTALQKAWEATKRAASNAFDDIGGGLAKGLGFNSDDESFADLSHQRDMAQGSQAPKSVIDDLNAKIAAVQSRLDAAQDKAQDAGDAIAANRLSISGGDIIRRALPDIGRRTDLETNIGGLKSLTGDPEAMDKLSGTAREGAAKALDNLNNKLEHFATAAQVVAQDSDFATRATLARTLSQKVAIESERSYADVMRSSGDRALASASAEAKRNEMIASGTKTILDNAREVANQHQLVGLNPYDRTLKEIDQRYDKMARDNIVADNATAATVRLTVALDRNADALAGRGAAGLGISPVAANSNLPTFASGQVADMARQAFSKYGIDPNTGIRVLQGESGLSPTIVGDGGSSFGVGQLHYGGIARGGNSGRGLGDSYTAATGFQAGDGVHTANELDFIAKNASQSGWGAWHAAKRAGIGNWDGIGGQGAAVSLPEVSTGPNPTAVNNQARATAKYDATTGQFIDSIDASNRALQVQTAMFNLQNETLGKTPGVIASATKQQELLDEAYQRGSISSLEFGKQTDELQAKLKGAGAAAATFASQEDARQKTIAVGDFTRSATKDSLHTIASDLLDHNGKNIGRDVGRGLGTKFLDTGIDSLTSGLFGKQGSPGGGLLGGLFGGATGLATATIQAGVVNVTSGAGSILGGVPGIGAATGGGSLGSLFGGIGKLFGFADGGVMSSGGSLPLHRYATGGVANSPQLAMFGEGRGPEAYVPLADGRTIPVSMKAGGAPANQNFSTGGSTIVVQGSADKTTLIQMEQRLRESEARQKADLKRNFGAYQRQFGSNYG